MTPSPSIWVGRTHVYLRFTDEYRRAEGVNTGCKYSVHDDDDDNNNITLQLS